MFTNGTQTDWKHFDPYCYCLFFKVIKYFQKFIINVQKLGDLYSYDCLDPFIFSHKVLKIQNVGVISTILYVFNTLLRVKKYECISTIKLLNS